MADQAQTPAELQEAQLKAKQQSAGAAFSIYIC